MMFKNWKSFFLRSLVSIGGITLLSFGAALSEAMHMGLDPFTAVNRGGSSLLSINLGSYQFGVNLIILILILLKNRTLIGWGTIYNMILVGYQVDFFSGIFNDFFQIQELEILSRILLTIMAILILTLGVAIYMDIKLGISPYDALTLVITELTSWRYSYARIGQDLLVVAAAFLLKGPVGISTLITGFFAGPLISFFSENIGQPLEAKVTQFSH